MMGGDQLHPPKGIVAVKRPLAIAVFVGIVSIGFGLVGCSSPTDMIASKDAKAIAIVKEKVAAWNEAKNKALASVNAVLDAEALRVEKALETGDWAALKPDLGSATASAMEGGGSVQAWRGTGDVTISYDPLAADDLTVPELEPAPTEQEWGGNGTSYREFADTYVPMFHGDFVGNEEDFTTDWYTAEEFAPQPWSAPEKVSLRVINSEATVDATFAVDCATGRADLSQLPILGTDVPLDSFATAHLENLDRFLKIGGRKVSLLYSDEHWLLPGHYKVTSLATGLPNDWVTVPDTIIPTIAPPSLEPTKALSEKAVAHAKAVADAAVARKIKTSEFFGRKSNDFERPALKVDGIVESDLIGSSMDSRSDKVAVWQPTEVETTLDIDSAGNLTATTSIRNADGTPLLAIAGKDLNDSSEKLEDHWQSATVSMRIDPETGKATFKVGGWGDGATRWSQW